MLSLTPTKPETDPLLNQCKGIVSLSFQLDITATELWLRKLIIIQWLDQDFIEEKRTPGVDITSALPAATTNQAYRSYRAARNS